METLIITGCIKSSYSKTVISNTEDRLNQYLKTIQWAIEKTNFDNVIFCDNSGFKYDFDEYVKSINNTNKNFEFLSFKGKNNVQKYGIGFGENEIMNYCFKNSKLLRNSETFWKLTGRLSIENVNFLINKHKKDKNVALMYYKWFDTRFFKCSTEIYRNSFLDLSKYLNEGFYLEKDYYDIMKNNKYKFKGFNNYPIYCGTSGSLGIDYKISKKAYMVNNLFCKIRLFNNQFIQFMYKKIRGVK